MTHKVDLVLNKENGTLLMIALYDGNGDRIFRVDYNNNSSYTSNKAGTTANAINGIGKSNPNKEKYISSSRNEFGVLE